jgi:ABC-2 type transport system ATP-binding protein
VDDVSCTVSEGEIFGILGPNGTGKTTTVECVEGLRPELTQLLGAQPQESR